MTDDFPHKDETYQFLGACSEVYNEMGCGFLESVYQECIDKERASSDIPSEAQQPIDLVFKGQELQGKFAPDLLSFGTVTVELKAVQRLAAEHGAQLINYLKACRIEVGLLVNFGSHPQLENERIVSQIHRFQTIP